VSHGSGEPGPIKLDRHGQSLWLWVGDGRWATMEVCVRRPLLQHTPQPASPTATVEADNSPTSDHLRLHLPFRSPLPSAARCHTLCSAGGGTIPAAWRLCDSCSLNLHESDSEGDVQAQVSALPLPRSTAVSGRGQLTPSADVAGRARGRFRCGATAAPGYSSLLA
jgi:hypothetical protein